MPALLNESRISIFTFEVTIKISPCFSIKYMYMMFSAESVYSVKTAVVSDGLEDTFSILLGMAFSIFKASFIFSDVVLYVNPSFKTTRRIGSEEIFMIEASVTL